MLHPQQQQQPQQPKAGAVQVLDPAAAAAVVVEHGSGSGSDGEGGSGAGAGGALLGLAYGSDDDDGDDGGAAGNDTGKGSLQQQRRGQSETPPNAVEEIEPAVPGAGLPPPSAASAGMFSKGAAVLYVERDGSRSRATVVSVDASVAPPSYGIALHALGGRVRETEGHRLEAAPVAGPEPRPGGEGDPPLPQQQRQRQGQQQQQQQRRQRSRSRSGERHRCVFESRRRSTSPHLPPSPHTPACLPAGGIAAAAPTGGAITTTITTRTGGGAIRVGARVASGLVGRQDHAGQAGLVAGREGHQVGTHSDLCKVPSRIQLSECDVRLPLGGVAYPGPPFCVRRRRLKAAMRAMAATSQGLVVA